MAKFKILGNNRKNQKYYHKEIKEENKYWKCLPVCSSDSFIFSSLVYKHNDFNTKLYKLYILFFMGVKLTLREEHGADENIWTRWGSNGWKMEKTA
jgi:hypothetical protein